MRVLTFEGKFNQPIILIPNITVLTFGCDFNQPIILTKNIIELTFGWNYNQPIIPIPNIKILTFHSGSNQLIISTPDMAHIPMDCKDCKNWTIFDNLSNSVKYLTLSYYYNLPLNNIPSSMIKITIFNDNYKYIHLIPEKLIGT